MGMRAQGAGNAQHSRCTFAGLRRHPITVDEYSRMAAVGLLAPDARVELIEGVIVDMPPMGARHAALVSRLHKLLERAAGDLALVRCQLPLRVDAFSEPQPDLALLRPREDFYEQLSVDLSWLAA